MTTAKRPPRQDRLDSRAALIQAAGELLETQGLAAVTLRAVGDQVGVSRTTPYRHFIDTEGLLAALAAADFERLGQTMADAIKSKRDPFARLEALALAYVRFALAAPARYRLMFGPEVNPRDRPAVKAAAADAHAKLVEVVAACQEVGQLPRDETPRLTALVYAGIHGVADLALAGKAEWTKSWAIPTTLSGCCLLIWRIMAPRLIRPTNF